MSKLNLLPELTKKYILERVTQEEIMKYYTKVEVNDITLTGNSFKSPFREKDDSPSCNYYYGNDSRGEIKLRVRDWNGTFHGDTFDVASFFLRIPSKSAQGFKLLLHAIAKDFKIHKYADEKERDTFNILIEDYHNKKDLKVFKVIPRAWNEYDKRYWYDNLGIGSDLLKIGKVIPVKELEIQGKDGYLYNSYKYFSKDPAYAYYGGKINGITIWKIYFPFRGKGRKFMTNFGFIQGEQLFKPTRVGLITKSYKDVLCYYTFGVYTKAVPSETYVMTKDEIFDIKSKCDVVFTNFDYDKAGILLANKYKRIHNILPLMFTRGRFNQPDFGVKDFSEYRAVYGKDKTKELISTILDKYREDLDKITLYNYNALKWIQ